MVSSTLLENNTKEQESRKSFGGRNIRTLTEEDINNLFTKEFSLNHNGPNTDTLERLKYYQEKRENESAITTEGLLEVFN